MFVTASNCKWRCPSAFFSSTIALIFVGRERESRIDIWVPTRARFPGRIIAHQSFVATSLSKKISNSPPVSSFTPRSRAEITRESFRTSTSPDVNRWMTLRNCSCPIFPDFRLRTSNRDWSRAESGICAIRSGGNRKSKSEVSTKRGREMQWILNCAIAQYHRRADTAKKQSYSPVRFHCRTSPTRGVPHYVNK
jgi:hypothetical protein